jgi:hypothetical protein
MYIFRECVVCRLCAAGRRGWEFQCTMDATTRHSARGLSPRERARASLTYIYFNSRGDLITCLLAVCQHKTVMCITLSRSAASPWALIHTAYDIYYRATLLLGEKIWRAPKKVQPRRVSKVSRLFHTLRVAIIVWIVNFSVCWRQEKATARNLRPWLGLGSLLDKWSKVSHFFTHLCVSAFFTLMASVIYQ